MDPTDNEIRTVTNALKTTNHRVKMALAAELLTDGGKELINEIEKLIRNV